MGYIAVAFWGAFFGCATLMLAGAVVLLLRSMRRAALTAAVSALVPMLYVLAFLGWLAPQDQDARDRLLAHINVVCGIALSIMLLSLLGRLRQRRTATRSYALMGTTGAGALLAGWFSPPFVALALGCTYGLFLSLAMLVVALRFAARRHRQASIAVGGVICILVGQVALSTVALLRGDVHWAVHAAGATAGVVYMGIMATALWLRVLHMIELREVMALGPSYDTITRMHAHSEAGKVVGAFLRKPGHSQSAGIVAVSIANLRVLESLHGRAAHNHALFVCASRLRSCAPMGAQLCRLGDDGFLMLINNPGDSGMLRQIARQVRQRLLRPINLAISPDAGDPEGERTEWMPEIGVGVAVSDARVTPGNAVATARASSRTAWGYPSRMAWSESATNVVTELAVEGDDSGNSSGMNLG